METNLFAYAAGENPGNCFAILQYQPDFLHGNVAFDPISQAQFALESSRRTHRLLTRHRISLSVQFSAPVK